MKDLMCDVCGSPAVVSVIDFTETIGRNGIITTNPIRTINRYCNDHKRESKCVGTFDECLFPCLNS